MLEVFSILQDNDNNKHIHPSWNGLAWWDFYRKKSKHLPQQRVLRMSRKASDRKREEKGTGKEFFILTFPYSPSSPALQICNRESRGLWKNVQLLQAFNQLLTILPFHLASRSPQESLAAQLPCNKGCKRKLFWVLISPWKIATCFRRGITLMQGFRTKC